MKYRLSSREIPRTPPLGFSSSLGDISLYTPPLITIQLQYNTSLCNADYRKLHGCIILSFVKYLDV